MQKVSSKEYNVGDIFWAHGEEWTLYPNGQVIGRNDRKICSLKDIQLFPDFICLIKSGVPTLDHNTENNESDRLFCQKVKQTS